MSRAVLLYALITGRSDIGQFALSQHDIAPSQFAQINSMRDHLNVVLKMTDLSVCRLFPPLYLGMATMISNMSTPGALVVETV